jgi:cbb3-type cytochrome oxidase subunit 1
VWCLRAALIYLLAGFILGAIMLAAPALHLPGSALRVRPLHAELLLVGWMLQLAFGVAYWILPRFRTGAARGSEWGAWASVLLLNVGVWTVGLGLMLGIPTVPFAGRAAELLAALTFAVNLWARLRSLSPGTG